MRKSLVILVWVVTIFGAADNLSAPQRKPSGLFQERDKQAHIGAGMAFGLACNMLMQKWTRPKYEHEGYEYTLSKDTLIPVEAKKIPSEMNEINEGAISPVSQAWWCTLAGFFGGMAFEYLQFLESDKKKVPDGRDVLATSIGAASAGIFRIVIEF